MDVDLIYIVLTVCALIVMSYAFFRIIMLRRKIRGGTAKNPVNLLAELVGVFTVGYLVAPFFSKLPEASIHVITGILFFAVAIFVVIVVDLFQMIVSELGL